MRDRFVRLLPPVVGVAVFAAASFVLHRELAHVRYRDVTAHLAAIPLRSGAAAFLFTVLGHVAIASYDALALAYVGKPLGRRYAAWAGFVGTVFSQNVGLSVLSGGAVRYHMYTSWGLAPGDVARLIAFNVAGLWLGFFAVAGSALACFPLPVTLRSELLASSRALGLLLLVPVVVYGVASWTGRPTLRACGFELEPPRPSLVAGQLLLASLDWAFAGAVLYALLPADVALGFPRYLGAYLLAQGLGLVSHVPGGLGVFETTFVLLLAPFAPPDAVLASVLAYRIVYYLVPLGLAVAAFGAYEALARRRQLALAGNLVGRWAPEIVPRVLAFTTLLAGAMLLVSGATAAAPGRLELLLPVVPLPAVELSHFLSSVIGGALLVLGHALLQRLDAAYLATVALLTSGVVVSLAKGLDVEEAALLAAMLAAFAPCRRYFDRRSSLLAMPLSPDWIAGVVLVGLATTSVTLFAHRHVDYAHELWWRFEADGHAPRALRTLVGGAIGAGFLGLRRLLRAAPPEPETPTSAEVDRIATTVGASPVSSAHLALLGDKRFLVSDTGRAFLMYGVEGRSFVAMGDPVGPPAECRELAWRFHELADRHGAFTVFYEVRAENLPLYVELGLRLRKLGEEARVPLADFGLEGRKRADVRHAYNRMRREGATFEVVPREAVPPLLDKLEAISDEWLREKATREKRFSLGFFDRGYLSRTPAAIVRRDGRIEAFANVWLSGDREELSIDLMRYSQLAPHGVMQYLVTELMLWGREQGYRWFVLGMAPLAGVETHRLAPLWNKLGALLFRHGEHFYNFQGLRAFKEKFQPVWEPRFLAAPGGLAGPLVLTNVAALVSGGVRGVIAR